VRIGLLIGMLMVPPMHGHPMGRRVLHAADAERGEAVLQPFRANQAAMRQHTMVAKVDAEAAEHVDAADGEHNAGGTEEPRQQSQQRKSVEHTDGDRIGPYDAMRVDGGRQLQAGRRGQVEGGGLGDAHSVRFRMWGGWRAGVA